LPGHAKRGILKPRESGVRAVHEGGNRHRRVDRRCRRRAGLGLYDHWVGQQIADISARLVTDAELVHPEEPAATSGIKLAPLQCARVYDLRANPIARRLEGTEIRALWRRCERIADIAAGLDKIKTKLPQ
jgi:hypothetical protein